MKKLMMLRFIFLSQGLITNSMCAFASGKYGAVITDLKGSVGGTTFKGTKAGAVMQNKITTAPQGKSGGKITKADAGRVINTQRNQSSNVQLWKGLSDSDRASWNSGAVNFPFKNKFGDSYISSGYQLFISVNNNLLAIGQAPLTVCPSAGVIDDCPAFGTTFTGGGSPTLAIDPAVPAGYYLTVCASASQSAGRNLESGRLKAIVILPPATSGSTDITTAYENIFGTLPSSGNIWVVGKITKADAGRQGMEYRTNCAW